MKTHRLVFAIATLALSAFCAAATVAERSAFAQGHWWNPARSGSGFEIFSAARQFAVVWHTFAASGAPTWLAGYQRASRTVEYFTCTGACPSCAYTSTVTRSAGTLAFDFAAENQLSLRNALTVAMAPGVNVEGARMIPLSRPASWRAADRLLANFADAAALKAYLGAGLQNIVFSSGTDSSPPAPSAPFSTTNLQEIGVDEADLVKSDGQSIYAFAHAGDYSATRLPAIRVARVSNEGEGLEIRGTVALASGPSAPDRKSV